MGEKLNDHKDFYNSFCRMFNSLLIFLVTFACANLLHQMILAGCSKYFNYKTVTTFGSVHSYPSDNHAWSTPRVLFIYTLPLIGCGFMAFILFYRFFVLQVPHRDISRFFVFWLVTNLILVVTTYMSVAPLGEMNHKYLYQDLSVIGSWFGMSTASLLLFPFLGLLMNLLYGVILSRELLRFAHHNNFQDTRSGRFYLFRIYFLFPLLLGIPATILFSYPGSTFFHIFMVMHAFLFVPAIYINFKGSDPVDADKADYDFIGNPRLILLVILAILIALIRIFLVR